MSQRLSAIEASYNNALNLVAEQNKTIEKLTTHTKDLEDENAVLRKMLENNFKLIRETHAAELAKAEDENKRLVKDLQGAAELNYQGQQLADEVKRLREALQGIKLHCLTSKDRAERMLIHVVRLCRDAGVTEDYTELQALTKPT